MQFGLDPERPLLQRTATLTICAVGAADTALQAGSPRNLQIRPKFETDGVMNAPAFVELGLQDAPSWPAALPKTHASQLHPREKAEVPPS